MPPRDGRVTIDDGSSPPLPGATSRLPVTGGPAAARNAGRRFVDTELIAFVDADVETTDGWLDPLLAHFDDPSVGLVAPRVTGERASPLDLGAEAARIRAGTRVSYVPGAAMVVRTAAFDAVGGFDPTLRFGEDVDFVWRLDEAGWRCRYEPASTVWHEPRRSWRERLRQHAGYGSSAAPLALRHPGRWRRGARTVGRRSSGSLALLGAVGPAALTALGSAAAFGPEAARPPSFGVVPPGDARSPARWTPGGQSAVRRVWWPLVLVGAIGSKRLRLVADRLGARRPARRADRHRLRLGRVAGNAAPPDVGPDPPGDQRMAGADASAGVSVGADASAGVSAGADASAS